MMLVAMDERMVQVEAQVQQVEQRVEIEQLPNCCEKEQEV